MFLFLREVCFIVLKYEKKKVYYFLNIENSLIQFHEVLFKSK